MISVLEAYDHITHAIGGPLVGISNQRVLDEAGTKLYRQNDWLFLKRPSATIGLTISQAYAALPADFGSIVELTYTSNTAYTVNIVSISEIARLREKGISQGGQLFVAVDAAADANGKPISRLEVFPTPTATDSTALTLFYRAGWVSVGTATTGYIAGIPTWLEDVYLQFVRAVAMGYQKQNMPQEIATVTAGPDYGSAVRYDRAIQWKHGPLSGGMLSQVSEHVDYLSLEPAAPAPA